MGPIISKTVIQANVGSRFFVDHKADPGSISSINIFEQVNVGIPVGCGSGIEEDDPPPTVFLLL